MINTYANYMRLVEELEQEQAGHAETRKLLLKACNERDGLLESIRYICDSSRIAAAAADYAANAADYATDAADYATDRTKALAESANIVQKLIKEPKLTVSLPTAKATQ